jgi:hypothetical protein
LPAYLVLGLAFALRAFEVGRQALRGDEGFSVTFVLQPLGAMFRAMATSEPNPPLYWLLLRGWLGLAGRSELAARWPSVLAGVLAAALTYRLGRALAGRAVGLVAMLLVAISPFLIWYGQDARVYSLLTALVVGATWLTWEAARRRTWTWWAAAGALWWLALFAHYFAALAFAAVGAATGLALLLEPATRPRWRPAALMALGVILAYLPWAFYVGPLLAGQNKSWIQPLGFGQALAAILAAASAGPAVAGATPVLQFAGAVLLAVFIVAGTADGLRHRRMAAIWLLVMGLGPPLALWLASLARPVFTEQYFISCLPALLCLAAWGLRSPTGRAGRWPALRPLQATGLALWAAIALAAAQNSTFNPAFAKSPDWRGLVSYLAQTARPGEVVIVNLPDPAFFLYYHGPMPVETSPPAPLAQAGTAATEAQLARLRDQFQHVRFLFEPSPAYDPDGFTGAWLDACCEKMDDRFVNGFRIQTYDTPSGSLAARQTYRADFAGGPGLTGYRVTSTILHAGDVSLYWTTAQPITNSYTVFVHLLAADGFDQAQADSLPAGGRHTTDQWAPGSDVIDAHSVALPADLPPGDYQLEVGLYLLATGKRVPLVGSTGPATDAVRLPVTITVAAR